jgi:Ca2+-binding RTX toxin-like protein
LGGTGDDTIFGGQGDDIIFGNAGNDHIFGNRYNDFIDAGSGTDTLYFFGNFGNDTVDSFQKGTDIATFDMTATVTIMVDTNTVFTFADGSSVEFLGVTLTSADLVFV